MKSNTIALNYGRTKVPTSKIKYIESVFGNYSKIHLIEGNSFLTAFTLKHYYIQLKNKPNFQLARKGLLINLDLYSGVKQIDSKSYVELSTGETFRMSRRKGRQLMSLVS